MHGGHYFLQDTRTVWSKTTYGILWVAKDQKRIQADGEDSDQTGLSLRWAHMESCRKCCSPLEIICLAFCGQQRHAEPHRTTMIHSLSKVFSVRLEKHLIWAASSEKVPSRIHFILHMQGLIRVFALHSNSLYCPMIILADSEGPDHTARMIRAVWSGTSLSAIARRHVFAMRSL